MIDAWIVFSRGLLQGGRLRKTTLLVLGFSQANNLSGVKLHYEAKMFTFGLSYHFQQFRKGFLMVRMWCWFKWTRKIVPHVLARVACIVCLTGLAVSTYAQASDVTPDAAPVAIVGGVAIYKKDLLPLISQQLHQLRNRPLSAHLGQPR